ncbi:MAG: capsid cement protein [Rhodospirillaceae bacterium]
MAGTIAPFPKHQFFDNNGDPAAGYQLFVYAAGTTTKINSWTDVDLTAANTNPIILDSAGRATIFLDALSYKFVFTTADDDDPPTSPIWTVDNVSAVPSAGVNVDVAGVAGETIEDGECVYLENGDLGTAGRWYLTSNFTMAESVGAAKLGIALGNAAAGEDVTVRTAGRITTGSAVTPGTIYYLSDTAGALETPIPVPEQGFELPYAFAFADSASTLIFPLQTDRVWGQTGLRTVALSSGSSGQGCTSGSVDTDLEDFEVFVPADYLDTAGNAIILEGYLAAAANGNTKVFKVKIGSATAVTIWSSTANVASHVVPFRVIIQRRTSALANVIGLVYAGAASGNTVTPYMTIQDGGAVDWTANQYIKLMASGQAIDDISVKSVIWYAVKTGNGGLT